MSYECRGCDGTCCTGIGSNPCTCPPPSSPAPPPGPALEALLAASGGRAAVLEADGSYLTHCPAHVDEHPSLTFKQLRGAALIRCHSGCTPEEVLAALNMSFGDIVNKN